MKSRASLLLFALLHAVASAAQPVSKPLNLLDLIKSGAVDYHVNATTDVSDSPKDIWSFSADGTLHISGRGHGYVATREEHRDFHLVIEFKWGTKTWGRREKSARHGGVIVHGHGAQAAIDGTWLAGIGAQILEGGVGDILVLSAPGTAAGTSLSAECFADRNGERIWKKGAPRQTISKGRINWKSRDEEWTDRTGFRGRNDVESPTGEWNRLEVIARGGSLQIFVNGALVNEASSCEPAGGKVALQSEGAEMIVRRFELHPIGSFTEKWTAIQASGGSDVTVRAGQTEPLSPGESQKRIQFDGPYEAQLVAAEPLVLDPVECTWDAQGRMCVADMRDYPLGPPNPGDPWLSRIQLLTDEDGDGRMDKAVTFADHIDHVQGLLPYHDGLIATTRTQILFLKDKDGDGRADEIRPLIKGFNPKHSQLQVSAPRWGLDNCVHFNNGLDAKEIYPADKPDGAVGVPGANFKWNPRTGEISPTGGKGQYGGAFDDWGHHFYCSNRNPVMFTVMPWEVMLRNPDAGITQNYEDIAPYGAETRVYPLQITHTTADAHAGTNTASCGLGVYRGHLMPELKNNVFVPDPTGQLITRYRIEPKGASFKATRVGDRTEFFRSSDEWCRPVNFTTGPDGAIYVCDIYRRWIDHARFFPEEFVKSHDMRQGENHGRIWRIVPKGAKPPKIEAAPQEVEKLVAWLGHENAWQRETAQRLLVERIIDDKQYDRIPPALNAAAKMQASDAFVAHLNGLFFATVRTSLSGNDATQSQTESVAADLEKLSGYFNYEALSAKKLPLAEEVMLQLYAQRIDRNGCNTATKTIDSMNHRVVFSGLMCLSKSMPDFGREDIIKLCARVLNRFPEDEWFAKAVVAQTGHYPGRMLAELMSTPWCERASGPAKVYVVRKLVSGGFPTVDGERPGTVASETAYPLQTLEMLGTSKGELLWWKPAFLQGLADGLPRLRGKQAVKTLSEFVAKPPKGLEDVAKEIGVLLAKVDEVIADPKAPLDQRLAVLPLLAQRKWESVRPVAKELLTTAQPPEMTAAALALVKKFPAASTAPLIYELLPGAGPAVKRELIAALTANGTTALDLFKRMEKGEFPAAWVDVETRWRYQRGKGEMAELAKKLFGEASGDRAAVVAKYLEAARLPGDATRGRQIFATICVTCHKHGDLGVEFGPPLSDVKAKPPEALLSDILDPNRMFEARWSAYQIDTTDGRSLTGLVHSETGDSVVLAMMGGVKETLPRSAIKEMKSLDRSLMPPGLEGAISKEQMADLLAFLRGG